MNRNNIRAPGDALDYLTDCTLATVSDLAMKKSRSEYEFTRQKAIAMTGISLMKQFGVTPTGRAADVIAKFAGRVDDWAAEHDVKAKATPTPSKGQP